MILKILFNNTELSKVLRDRSKDQKRQIQMIYQMADTAMNPRQPVGEIIGRPLAFYLSLKGDEKDNGMIALKFTKLFAL